MTLKPTHPGERRTQNRLTRSSRLNGYAVRLVVILLAAVGLSGCQSISMNSAQLRVIDASPDSGVIDSYQNTSALAYNLGFGTMTSYVPMSSGAYNLAADKAGTRQTLVLSTDTLVAGKQYTEIIGSSLVNMQQTLLLDQSSPAPAGQIAVRLVNEATRSGAVDVYLVPMSGRLVNTAPIAINLSFGGNSGYINMPNGTYAIDVVPSGTTLAASTVTLLSGAQVEYASGAVRTIVLIDQENLAAQHAALSQGVQAIVAADADAQ
jgi:hypothetical protein